MGFLSLHARLNWQLVCHFSSANLYCMRVIPKISYKTASFC